MKASNSLFKQRRRDRIVSCLQTMMVVLSTIFMCSVPVFAGDWKAKLDTMKQAVVNIFSVFCYASSGICVLGIAWTGLNIITGGPKEMEEGVKRIKWLVAAFAVLLALPVIIKTGRTLFSGIAWDPTNPNQYIGDIASTPTPGT